MSTLEDLQKFIEDYVEKLKPLFKKANLTWWDAYTIGKKEHFEKHEEIIKEIKKLHNNKEEFEKVKELLKTEIKDPLIKRQLKLIHDGYLSSQGDINLINEIISKEVKIEQKFNNFRAKVNEKILTDNEIKDILKKETNSEKLKEVWEASKRQGEIVEKEFIEVIKLRNKLANSQGFENYYIMSLEVSEQKIQDIKEIFEELEELTDNSFKEVKYETDSYLSKKFKIPINELKPWHYYDLFFQKGPETYNVDLDKFFEQDILEISKKFYKSIGIDVEEILQRSDLYEKEGKSQHALAIDVDREGDVRILENIKNNEYWMNTTLHELGHGIYWEFINKNLPFLLRDVAHTFTTEGIAMFFGRQSQNISFIKKYAGDFNEDYLEIYKKLEKMSKMSQLVFSRWAQVMVNFEMKLYENPTQDLNKLWWDIVKKHQLIDFYRDKPDWASKMHFVSAPVYYHNYMLGELFASQLHNKITKEILKKDSLKNVDYSGNNEVGNYLKKSVFGPGMSYEWNDLIEKATGEKLTPKHFVEEFA